MSCVNFKTKEKNNKWREVALDLEKEKSIPKYFGIDTESPVNELLQNNITLFEWIRKNQGFPYFIGRRINGQNAITHDEMSYISSNGAKVIPILTVVTEKSAKDNARIAVALLDDLGIERKTPVFADINANSVNDEFLKNFATEIISSGYIPGFYVDTDSYNNFDRLFSRAYQSDVELMRQCRIWALSPEMDEFFETKSAHTEKPDIWGPFAPSCISKEQVSFWQYGKKCNPINTYRGDMVDFNLNLTIEPEMFFSVSEAKICNYKFYKDKDYKFEACVTDGSNIETVSLNCDFIQAKSSSLIVNDKLYAENINSSHTVLQFVICKSNDVFSVNHSVTEDNVLIKLAFVSKEKSCVYHFKKLFSLKECDLLKEIIANSPVLENDEEILKVSAQETWFAKFITSNNLDNSRKTETNSNVENYIYKANDDIFDSEIVNIKNLRSSIIGDTNNIFATIPQSAVKHSGSQYCTIKDVYGRPATAYYKDTMQDYDGKYISKIAVWSLNPVISSAQNADRLVEFTYQKAYNAFVYYYPSTDKIKVVYCDDDHTYVVTTNTQISINLVGCQSAYINKCSFEVSLGGSDTDNVDFIDDALAALGYATSEIKIVGKLADVVSNIYAGYSFLNDVSDAITNFNYNKTKHEYSFFPKCNLVTKQVGSTFKHALGNKNSLLKIRSTLDNVTVYFNSAIYCQVQTKVLSTFAGNNESICIGGSMDLK